MTPGEEGTEDNNEPYCDTSNNHWFRGTREQPADVTEKGSKNSNTHKGENSYLLDEGNCDDTVLVFFGSHRYNLIVSQHRVSENLVENRVPVIQCTNL